MSVVFSHRQGGSDPLALADLVTPMQFKTVLLVAYGLGNPDIAQVLGTTEHVIKNALADACNRAGCRNTGELVERYFLEIAAGLLELGRVRREWAELEARAAKNLHTNLGSLFRQIN